MVHYASPGENFAIFLKCDIFLRNCPPTKASPFVLDEKGIQWGGMGGGVAIEPTSGVLLWATCPPHIRPVVPGSPLPHLHCPLLPPTPLPSSFGSFSPSPHSIQAECFKFLLDACFDPSAFRRAAAFHSCLFLGYCLVQIAECCCFVACVWDQN